MSEKLIECKKNKNNVLRQSGHHGLVPADIHSLSHYAKSCMNEVVPKKTLVTCYGDRYFLTHRDNSVV